MNEIPISPQIWKLAGEVCTQQQRVALELRERHGFSWNQIAITMNLTKATVREHHRAATKNVYDALERQRLDGTILNKTTSAEPRPRPEAIPVDTPIVVHGVDHSDPPAAPKGYRTPDFGTLHRLDDELAEEGGSPSSVET